MSIIDELREWTRNHTVNCSDNRIALVAIAERIDEAHKHAIAYVDDRDPETMAEHGWVKLPVDAECEPIHVGDVMEWCDPDGEVTVTCEVDAVGVECFFAWDEANGRYAQKRANAYRHHHEPTVEDVLREFADVVRKERIELATISEETIAEYAKRLRLVGEGE